MTKAITPNKREIRQLWDAICELFKLAEDEFNKLDARDRHITVKKLAIRYRTGIPKRIITRRPNKLNTLLSSAAVRLTTISEICRECGQCILDDNYLTNIINIGVKTTN